MTVLTSCDTDDFNRANSTTTMGSTAQGRAWTPYATSGSAPTLGIDSNRGYFVTSAVGGKALIDPEIPNVKVGVTLADTGGGQDTGLAVRHHASDSRCYTVSYGAGRLTVNKVNAVGTGSPLKDDLLSVVDGDRIEVEVVGDLLTVWLNGSIPTGYDNLGIDPAYGAFTKVGLYEDQETGGRFEDFEVCPVVLTGWQVDMIAGPGS